MEQEDASSFWFACPSGIKSHRFENPKDFLFHIQTCNQLFPSKKGHDTVEALEYAVCPQNSLHLKKIHDPLTGNRWSLSQMQKMFFKRCRHPSSMTLQNKQDTISLGAGCFNGYLTLVNSVLEENHREETPQEDIVQYDFEQERKQFLKEQQFAQTMGSSRSIRFSKKTNNQIVNMALVRTSKDLRLNFRNFGNSCEILDEDEEGFQLNVRGDRRKFINRLIEDRPGMYLTVTQKNSIAIQMEFDRPREYYFVSVGEKEIGLLMKQQFEASKTFKLVFLSQEEYSRKAAKLLTVSPQCNELPGQCLLPSNPPPPILLQTSDYQQTKNLKTTNIMQKENKKPSILLYSNSTTNPTTASSKVTITIDNEVEIIDLAPPIPLLSSSEHFSDKKIWSPFSISSSDESTMNNEDNEWLEQEYAQQHQPEEEDTIIQLEDDKHNFVIFRKARNFDNKNKLHCQEINILHRNISKLKNSKIKTFTISRGGSSNSSDTGKIIPKKNLQKVKYNETIQELRKQQTSSGNNTQSFADRLLKLVSNKESEATSLMESAPNN